MSIADARRVLDRFLLTDPADVGCGQALAMLHAYAELATAGEDPEAHYPGITVHLRTCAPCDDDYQGLLLTVRETGAN